MKTKKKPTTPKQPNPIKLLNIKTLEPQKNTAATSQKTYMTIEQNIRTLQNSQVQSKRQSFNMRFSFSKKSCHQRMEQHNLSPFSNDGRSPSPKYRKTPQKLITARQQKQVKFTINLKQLQKKKCPKTKVNSARQTYNNKKPITINKTVAINIDQKKKPVIKKKKSEKTDKQEKARIQFQNEFLSMMNNRINKQKITEISDQDLEGSIRRKPKLEICIQSNNGSREDKKLNEKKQILKTMKLKVMKRIQRDYPNLDSAEKKVICAVIIIQQLWRQRKVKQFLQPYVTPKASPQSSFRQSLQKQISSNNSTMNLLTNHMAKKPQQYKSCDAVKVPRKKPSVPQQFTQNFLIRQKSSESCNNSQHNQTVSQSSSVKKQSKLNDKVTKLFEDSILPFQNDNQKIIKDSSNMDHPSMIKFIECYRQIKLSNPKKQTNSKRNIFSLKQSLSEKCLMQKYYTRIFSDKPQKDKPKNYELFSLNNSRLVDSSLKQNQQSSIELFKEINKHSDYISPQKLLKKDEEDQQVWVRNDTNYSQQTDSDQFISSKKDEKVKAEKVIVDQICHGDGFYKHQNIQSRTETQNWKLLSPKDSLKEKIDQESCGIVVNQRIQTKPLKPQEKPQFSLKSIHKVSQQVITQLMNEFFKQYVGFQEKQCLVKKHRSSRSKQEQKQKKPRLPGIQITQKSITQYLDILIPYILNQDRQQVLRSLQLFHPSTYQKCHRVESPVYEVFDFAQEEQEDDIYWNIISNEGFFLCLQAYWQKNVTLTKQKQKFTNFLDLTYKVYNRCITDAFSQIFNKQVLQRIVYPWNKKTKYHTINFSKQLKSILNTQMIQTIAEEVKQKLLKQSFCYSTTNGRLIKRDRRQKLPKAEYEFGEVPQEELMVQKLSDDEFGKVMKIANDEFLQDEKELMYCADQRYELNADISQAVLNELMKQLQSDLIFLQQSSSIEQPPLSKSQNQIFLQTNETLQTNYHC